MITRNVLHGLAAFILSLVLAASMSGCSAPKPPEPAAAPPPPANSIPIVAAVSAVPQVVQPLGTSQVTCQASDADGDTLSYQWTCSGGVVEGTGPSAVWTAPKDPGGYRVTVIVNDGKGGIATSDTMISIPDKPNNAPTITAIRFTRPGRSPITVKTDPTDVEAKKTPELVIRKYETGEVSCLAADQDKDQLTYVWKATGGKIIGNGPNIQWLAAGEAGTYTITCEVSDGKGGSDSFTITVSVHCCSG
jgi:hypothetical protein